MKSIVGRIVPADLIGTGPRIGIVQAAVPALDDRKNFVGGPVQPIGLTRDGIGFSAPAIVAAYIFHASQTIERSRQIHMPFTLFIREITVMVQPPLRDFTGTGLLP